MLATDHLLFIHLHKSGGTFVNQFLMRHGSNPVPIGKHLPYSEVPDELARLPVLGTVRDPLSYYVSWYNFQRAMPRPNSLFMICSDGGALGFAATIRNLLWLERDEYRLRLLEDAVPDVFVSAGLNLTKRCVRNLRGSGLGFYTYLYQRMFGGARDLHLVATGRIRTDLPALLRGLGSPPDEAAMRFLGTRPNLNTSEHGAISDYYDSQLKEEVRARDAPVWAVATAKLSQSKTT